MKMTPLQKEKAVRDILSEEFNIPLSKKSLVVGTKSNGRIKLHEFDCVSPDESIVAEVKSNELKTTPQKPNGRYFSAIKWALLGDIYMLSRINASTKLLVLTNKPLFDLCSQDMDGILPQNTKIIHRTVKS